MENIIKKAIEGGYGAFELLMSNPTYLVSRKDVCDPLFWHALGKACGWKHLHVEFCECPTDFMWSNHALKFHEINLTEGWDKAVAYLENLIK